MRASYPKQVRRPSAVFPRLFPDRTGPRSSTRGGQNCAAAAGDNYDERSLILIVALYRRAVLAGCFSVKELSQRHQPQAIGLMLVFAGGYWFEPRSYLQPPMPGPVNMSIKDAPDTRAA